MKSISSFLKLTIVLSAYSFAEIIRYEDAPVCFGVSCENGGILDNSTCVCSCADRFSGLFCETKLKTSSWPPGTYGIPMSVYGCPETEDHGWITGYINMTISDEAQFQNQRSVGTFVTKQSHLLGPYDKSRSLQMNFCVKTRPDGGDVSWPEESYCIYRVNRTCPQGFHTGSVNMTGYMFDMHDMSGWLPDFRMYKQNESGETILELIYCCTDGFKIKLKQFDFAKDYPFYLIKLSKTCPTMFGSTRSETFHYAAGVHPWTYEGAHPEVIKIKEKNNGTGAKMSYCHFRPTDNRDRLHYLQKRKPAFSSAALSGEFAASNINDGDTYAYFWTEAQDMWIVVDMQHFYPVFMVNIQMYSSGTTTIMVSRNPWDFLFNGAFVCRQLTRGCSEQCYFDIYCRRSIMGRYLSIREEKSYALGIYEIDIQVKGTKCGKQFGLISGAILDLQQSFSSRNVESSITDGVCFSASDPDPYVQVDFIVPVVVQGLIIQGWRDSSIYMSIRSFTVAYGVNKSNLMTYEDMRGNKVIVLNEKDTVKHPQTILFDNAVLATVIQINVIGYVLTPCLKLEVIGCPKHVSRDISCRPSSQKIGWGQIEGHMFRPKFAGKTLVKNATLEKCKERCSENNSNCLSVSIQNNRCYLVPLERYHSMADMERFPSSTYAEKICLKDVRDIRQCWNEITKGTLLTSPAYPLYYGEEVFCTWLIAFKKNKTIKIDVLELNLMPADASNCLSDGLNVGRCEDHLRIFSTDHLDILTLHRENHQGSTLYSSTNELFIELFSCDRSTNIVSSNFSRFVMNISESDLVGCGFIEQESSVHICKSERGIIASPFNPANYRLTSEVSWRIIGKKGKYIQLKLSTMDIPSDENCMYSHLAIYNIDLKGEKSLIDKYCTWNQKFDIVRSNLNKMELTLASALDNYGSGFTAVYEIVNGDGYVDVQTEQNLNSSCDKGWINWGGSCYKYYERKFSKTWNEAEEECIKHGGHLLSVNTREEMFFIHHLLTSELKVDSPVIVGLHKTDAAGRLYDYSWADGQIATYFDWYSDALVTQPDGGSTEMCTVITPSSMWSTRSWHDYMCAYNGYNRFICEISSHTNQSADIITPQTFHHLESNSRLFVCDDKSVISRIYWCDGIKDCPDASDEKPECNKTEDNTRFLCNSGQRVHLSKYCDFSMDCGDGSDEINCQFRECNDSEWRCKNKKCIKRSKRCDFKVDCEDRSDEDNCNVCVDEGFQCYDQMCIPSTRICDGFVDCTGEFHEDEEDTCITKSRYSCEAWYRLGEREDGMYLVNYGGKGYFPVECIFPKEAGSNDVTVIVHHDIDRKRPLKVSEHTTPNYGATRKQIETLKGSIDCQQNIALHCSGYGEAWVEIEDKSEYFCTMGKNCPIVGKTSKCSSEAGQVVHRLSLGEENWVTDTMSLPKTRIPVRGVFDASISIRRTITIGPIVCQEVIQNITSDLFLCKNKNKIHKKHVCILSLDDNGEVEGCRDMTHLENCEEFSCPVNFVKCPNSFCIPRHMYCDGILHCPGGADEFNCDRASCSGNYKCRNSTLCLPTSEICDGIKRCPHGDDEFFCGIAQHENCVYEALLATCNGTTDIAALTDRVRKLNITDGSIVQENTSFHKFFHLGQLIISRSKFENMSSGIFETLANLFYLDLSDNLLTDITNETFKGLRHLLFLNISMNKIFRIEDGTFSHLSKLETLDLRENEITVFNKTIFSGLSSLKYLYTNEYKFCCIKPTRVTKENCYPSEDEFSSCADLMRNDVLRICLWMIGTFALLGNVLGIIFRLLFDRESLHNAHGLFVLNLCLSDFLMGVYLFIIASADEFYRGNYIWNENEWRNSRWCKAAGFLVTLSSEVSTTMLCIITLDRLLAVKYPFSRFQFTAKRAGISLIFIWAINIILASVPLLPFDYFQDSFYSRSGVCLALPLTRDRPPGWLYSISIFLICNFIAFLVIMFGQIAIYLEIRSVNSSTVQRASGQEQNIARDLFIIVFTDFLCWFPVAIMGMSALNGHVIPGEIYAWTAVFVVPINSALNPILYTITSYVRKQKYYRASRRDGKRMAYSREQTKLYEIPK